VISPKLFDDKWLKKPSKKELYDLVEEQRKEIEKLTAESTKWESKFYDEAKKVDKAIEYIENRYHIKGTMTYDSPIYHKDLLDILKGVDKE